MDRRAFCLGGVAICVAPLAVAAQPAGKPTIGVLATTQLTERLEAAIREGLKEHGYVEGRNIAIEWRAADGRLDRAAVLATELAQRRVDVIVAVLSVAVQAAKNATATIPIVMAPAGDPVTSGFVVSLARPGRNVTGVTGIGGELAGKQLEALRQLVPRLTRVALLVNPEADTFSKAFATKAQAVATTSGIKLHVVNVSNAEELDRAFAAMADQRDEGVLVQGPIFIPSFGRIVALGQRYRLPLVSAPREFAEAGGLLAYGANQVDLMRRAMSYVARILRGARPADLPVEQPTKFDLVINVKTAKALGITIPASLLARADQVIQ